MLDLWSFESGGQELYALTSGRIPPAEEHLIKNWKRLSARVEATEDAIAKITYERPKIVFNDVERQGYHMLETKLLRTEWERPTH